MVSEKVQNLEGNEQPKKSRAKSYEAWEKLVRESDGKFAETQRRLAGLFPELSKTEVIVCVLIGESWENAKIAAVLGRDEHTINNHITEIRGKLKKRGFENIKNLRSFFASF